MNKINFRAWEKNTYFPLNIGNRTKYSIEKLGDSIFECSYKNGMLKATKNGEDVFVQETTPSDFSKNIILMHKTLLPDQKTFDEILDRLSLEA